MFFDTPAYVCFLTLVVVAYWRLSHGRQNQLLLAASYVFYGWWDWRFLGLMFVSSVVDYFLALGIASSTNAKRRKQLLIMSLVMNFGFLGAFKYFGFFCASLVAALRGIGVTHLNVPLIEILLPPGISFYTFQAVAYIVDVYHGKLEPSRRFGDYALFISLFPHLIAGPIQRPSHLLPQVQAARSYEPNAFFDGVLLILSGLFRKCVVADNCALIANAAFSGNFGPPGLFTVTLGAYSFAWQIYGDFSGYSDIARGSAQLLGFHFMENFRQPYLACSLREFWRRWHISLSTWLRDYLYIPLGGSRRGERRTYVNLMVTMLLGGLWHGANFTFVVWGLIHGVGLAIERKGRALVGLADDSSDAATTFVGRWVQRIVVFHVVCVAWIFFRADSVGSAIQMLSHIGRWDWKPAHETAFLMLALFTMPLFLMDLYQNRTRQEYVGQSLLPTFRIATAMAALVAITLFAAPEPNAFIYFQF